VVCTSLEQLIILIYLNNLCIVITCRCTYFKMNVLVVLVDADQLQYKKKISFPKRI